MTYTRRSFPEVLDNLLTDITGGVASESHPFPPPGTETPPFQHSLQQPPVSDVISVYGLRDGLVHLFRKDVDYVLLGDQQTLAWKQEQKGAQLPDAGTLLNINYYPVAAKRTLTDLQVGSVTRTLAESIGLEIARLYAQLEVVYRSGFVDTATGSSLENVVALLGIERVQGGHPAGEVEFTRAPISRGAVSIPAGTRVMTADGQVQYETTNEVTLAAAQNTIRVVARDLQPNDPLPADTLTLLPVPIAGILSVTNPAPTAIATQDESDDELRTRAKNFLHGSERATLGAIKQALAMQAISADVEEDPLTPGRIEITPHLEAMPPELLQRLLTAIEAVRPAGVQVILKGIEPPQRINLQIRLVTSNTLLPADLRAIQRSVRDKLGGYFAKLPAKEAGSVNKIVALVASINGVQDLRILSATVNGNNVLDAEAGVLKIAGMPTALGDLDLTDPNLPTMVNVVVKFPADAAPPDKPKIQTALNNALAYLNELNANELAPSAPQADKDKRVLTYGKLLRVIPLPTKAGEPLPEFDNAPGGITLPDETSILPYTVQVVLTQQSGRSQLLEKAGDGYALAPFERLSLSDVTV